MPGDLDGEEVGAVDVDGPELAHAVDGVLGGRVVLGEAGRCDQVVDLAVGGHDLGHTGRDGGRVGNVDVVGGDAGWCPEAVLVAGPWNM